MTSPSTVRVTVKSRCPSSWNWKVTSRPAAASEPVHRTVVGVGPYSTSPTRTVAPGGEDSSVSSTESSIATVRIAVSVEDAASSAMSGVDVNDASTALVFEKRVTWLASPPRSASHPPTSDATKNAPITKIIALFFPAGAAMAALSVGATRGPATDSVMASPLDGPTAPFDDTTAPLASTPSRAAETTPTDSSPRACSLLWPSSALRDTARPLSSATCLRAKRSSSMLEKRSSGFLAMALSTTCSSLGSMTASGATSTIEGGGSWMCAIKMLMEVGRSKGTLPVSISYMITPSA